MTVKKLHGLYLMHVPKELFIGHLSISFQTFLSAMTPHLRGQMATIEDCPPFRLAKKVRYC